MREVCEVCQLDAATVRITVTGRKGETVTLAGPGCAETITRTVTALMLRDGGSLSIDLV